MNGLGNEYTVKNDAGGQVQYLTSKSLSPTSARDIMIAAYGFGATGNVLDGNGGYRVTTKTVRRVTLE